MSRCIGIVGHEAAKFTEDTEAKARRVIRWILNLDREATLVSGVCHLGGIDIWAEEEAIDLRMDRMAFPPRNNAWNTGYKPRNIKIATISDEVHVIVVTEYPEHYFGRTFSSCYHCNTTRHIKSGGCWTGKYAQKLGKPAFWHEI